jgi:rhodanese-related sulfurtransferase
LRLITREELKRELDERDDVRLVCALREYAFKAMHIPGSIHVDTLEKAAQLLHRDDHIVVYCTNVNCPASIGLYHQLVSDGYSDVQRYAGGIEDWELGGYVLEGAEL